MSAENEKQDTAQKNQTDAENDKPEKTPKTKPIKAENDKPEKTPKTKPIKAACLKKCQHNGAIINKGDVVYFIGAIPPAKKHLFEEVE